MKRTIQLLAIVAGAALVGCSASPMSGTSQDTPPASMRDFYRPAYKYSGTAMPSAMPDAAAMADDMTVHASGHQ
ncbi:MAG: hypothetical protein ABSH20_04350 [Tepidisphaeraceae bacterium]|jgi:hypothetical protein